MQAQSYASAAEELAESDRFTDSKDQSTQLEPQSGRQKRKKSVPREMSSKHKTLNSDTESSDDEPSPITPRPPTSAGYSFPFSTNTTSEVYSRHGSVVSDNSLPDNSTEVKRGRGRPRKHPKNDEPKIPKRPRGRPRKNTNETIKALSNNYIYQGGLLIDRLNQNRMPNLVSQLRKGIAAAQCVQDSLDADGNLGETQIEYLESQVKNNVFF